MWRLNRNYKYDGYTQILGWPAPKYGLLLSVVTFNLILPKDKRSYSLKCNCPMAWLLRTLAYFLWGLEFTVTESFLFTRFEVSLFGALYKPNLTTASYFYKFNFLTQFERNAVTFSQALLFFVLTLLLLLAQPSSFRYLPFEVQPKLSQPLIIATLRTSL